MGTEATPRSCERCGARLARGNTESLCRPCQRAARASGPPDVAPEFWNDAELRDALLRERHIGHAVRIYRKHPIHGQRRISQEVAARWLNISQTQLARIENGQPITDLDRLIQWAKVLHIPSELLWFALPEEEGEEVNRREFLVAGGAGTAVVGGLLPVSTGLDSARAKSDECAQWLAWELWNRRVESLNVEEIPIAVRRALDSLPPSGTLILRDAENNYSFAHPSLIDFFIAQLIFGDLARGNSELLTETQTSHDTDQVIRRFVEHDQSCVPALSGWMRKGATPVLRVNSAGILAKLGRPDIADDVITSLREDSDTRNLYLTAVASRVLSVPWDEAREIAVGERVLASQAGTSAERAAELSFLLSQEMRNSQDGAARWCGVVLLSKIAHPMPALVSSTLQETLRREQCRENLRAIASTLSGADPLET